MSIDVNVQNDLVVVTESSEDITVNVSNAQGPAGVGVPSGGSAGQVLKKLSGTNYDTYWALEGGGVPYSGATGDVDLGEYELKAGQIELDQTPTGTAGVAVTRWNDTAGLTETTLKGGNVVLKNGSDLVARVVNKVSPNTTLTKAAYQVVRVSGAQGQRLAVALAQANNDNNSADTLGLVIETIATNQEGFIMTMGNLEGINTTGSLQSETWADGDVLYLSPTIAGKITNVKPTGATGHIVVVGYVEYAHANNGKIYVKVMNGWELDELHNVYITSPANGEALIYESATSLWKNKTIATALGYTPVTSARTLTINGTAYDLSADRSWTVSGTNIYTADGTLTGDRTVSNSTFLLKFVGGKEILTNEQTALRLETSTTAKELIFSLNNLSGKNWLIRSLQSGNLDFRNITNTRTSLTLDGASSDVTFSGNIKSSLDYFILGAGAFHKALHLGKSSVTNANYSIAENGAETMINADTGGLLRFRIANADKMMLTNAGRLLLGTTTESTYIFDAVGTARISGDALVNGLTVGKGGGGIASSTVLGFEALLNHTTNGGNVAIGYQSQKADVNGYYNTSVGYQSMLLLNSGTSNTAFGASALYSNVTGSGNTAVGYNAMYSNTSVENTAIGQGAMEGSTTASRSVAVGFNALKYSVGGQFNTAVGYAAATALVTGSYNTAIGRNSLLALTNGEQNTAVGVSALFTTTNAGDNTAIGFAAGYNVSGANGNTTGSNNIFIGSYCGGESSTESNRTWIGNTNTTSTWVGGNLLVGIRTNAGYKLDVNGTARVTSAVNSGLYESAIFNNTSATANRVIINHSANTGFGLSIGNVNKFSNAVYSPLSTSTYSYVIFNDQIGGTAGNAIFIHGATNNISLGGITDAGYKLDVQGTARVSEDARINNLTIGRGNGSIETNTAIGQSALESVTNVQNTAVGYYAGKALTNSVFNTVLGAYALENAQTYNQATAIGRYSLRYITTGGKVTAIGHESGTWYTGNVNLTDASDSIFIGYRANPLGNSQSNQIVIGHDVFGLGSNTTSIGNGSTTLTALRGSVIINGTSINASAVLQADSTTKGFLPPRMTSTERAAISSPAVGLIVYQTNGTEGTYEYTSGGWRIINASGSGGGITRSVNSISSNTTAGATSATDYVYLISGTTTLTLPTAVGNTNRYTLKNTGTNTVTINTTSSQTIDGSTSLTLAVQYTALDVISDGTNWNII